MDLPVVRWLGRLCASVVMVAAVTGANELLRLHVPEQSLLILYLLAILPVAVLWGTWLAGITALLSVAVFEYLFLPPYYSFQAETRDLVGLFVFLVIAVVVGQLTARLRREATVSARLTTEHSALRRVATLVAKSVPPSVVFEAVPREVGLLCGADLARMERYEPDGTVSCVAAWTRVEGANLGVGMRLPLDGPSIARGVRETGEPTRVASFAGAPGAVAQEARTLGIRSSVGCPIFVAGRLWGVIAASRRSTEAFPAGTEEQISNFTELVATAIENTEARAEVAAARARIVATTDQTRQRIERDLHDGAQQRLVSLALQVRGVQAMVPPELNELGAELDDIAVALTEAVDELREMARGIHPAILTEGGLAPALQALARRSSIPVDIAVSLDRELPTGIEISAYYVVSEAITNVAKHAQASGVTVNVDASDGALRISVADDGIGGADFTRGTGLVGLKDRVEALGGRIFLDSPPSAGTTLRAELPLSGAESADRD